MKDQVRSASDLPKRTDAVLPAAVQRQRDVFGPAAIDPLLASLRDRLAAILVANAVDARAAHQLAGLAGVLGFAELAEAWEGYSADGESRRADACRLGRLTLETLRRIDLSDSKA